MFFIIKALSAMFMPLPLGLAALVTGTILVWPLKKKRSGWIMCALSAIWLIMLGYGLVGDFILAGLESQYPALGDSADIGHIKWVVVLGGGMTSDPKVGVVSQLGSSSVVRTIEGIRIYRMIRGSKLLLSGGPVFNREPEAFGMERLAKAMGVPAGDIALEILSKNTVEQARIIRDMAGNDSLILVTSAAHMPRAMRLFSSQGMKCLAAPTDHLLKKRQMFNPSRLFPDAENLRKADRGWHERLGLLYARVAGN